MANIRLHKIILKDQWPGAANPNCGIPVDGWGVNDGTSPAYPVGQKRMVYTDNSHQPGMYTMLYGNLAAVSDTNFCISHDFSNGKCWCAHCCLSVDVSWAADPTYQIANHDNTAQPMYVMHMCSSLVDSVGTSDYSNSGGAALPCCSMDGYDYGWFWVGGVCPCKDATIMEGSETDGNGADMTTDDTIIGGGNVFLDVTARSQVPTSEFTLTAIELSLGAETQVVIPNSIGWASGPDV